MPTQTPLFHYLDQPTSSNDNNKEKETEDDNSDKDGNDNSNTYSSENDVFYSLSSEILGLTKKQILEDIEKMYENPECVIALESGVCAAHGMTQDTMNDILGECVLENTTVIDNVDWTEGHPANRDPTILSAGPLLVDIEIPDELKPHVPWHGKTNSYDDLVTAILSQDSLRSITLAGASLSFVTSEATCILLSIHNLLLGSLIRGDFPFQYRNDHELARVVEETWREGTFSENDERIQPVIYIQYIVNKDGYGLNAQQLALLRQSLLRYCDCHTLNDQENLDLTH
ncbi:hypothetical protein B0J11DRAFT_506968 [Dendryphion nanum]|uniref:Uncharacterized protein n=1 Tax=Dendryphion nanum TaxID=256645 RepID=A0A9P9DST1_9PLEO|nr:hypothetical protein B0J11DRAFT_506968 [Dendryphion nanum]